MNWFYISLIAQFILGTSALFDKILLGSERSSPVIYTFWLGILGLVSLALLPFGYVAAPVSVILLALGAGVLFIAGMLFFFWALHYSRAAGSVLSVSGFSPIATLLFSWIFLETNLAGYQLVSFILFVIGAFLLALIEEKGLRIRIFFFAILSAMFLGLSIVLSKLVFNQINFITGFFWIKAGGAGSVLLFFLHPYWRRAIFYTKSKIPPRRKAAYIGNRAYAGAGSVLVAYAVSLGIPPLVDAMQSVRFLFVFIGGWILLHRRFSVRTLIGEFLAFMLISTAVIILGLGDYLSRTVPDPDRPITWGVTFSEKFSRKFDFGEGRTWQDNYDAILDDLGARHIRLIAYWDILEPEEGRYDFSGLDYQMRRAEEVGANVIVAVGKKVPRWPECHDPPWVEGEPPEVKNAKLLKFAEVVVQRYKNSPALNYWQVENEPFLPFGEGECALSGKELLDAEIQLVREIDPARSIIVTDSGEIGPWVRAARRGDIFGTTMYRRVHNDRFGNFEYPIGPAFFRVKESITRFLIQDYEKKFLVIELGMEPWLKRQPYETTPKEQFEVFDFTFFKDSVRFAKDAGFDEYYLWGAEWWYWMKVRHGDSRFWEEAKRLLN